MFYNTFNSDKQSFANTQNGQEFFKGKCGHFRNKREMFRRAFATQFGNTPAINIEESEDAYTLYLYAAGRNKDGFTLSIKDQVLTIVYKSEKSSEKKFIYQEAQVDNFERSFQINDPVLTDQISAAYVDGVLTVQLPKDPEAKANAQNIHIN